MGFSRRMRRVAYSMVANTTTNTLPTAMATLYHQGGLRDDPAAVWRRLLKETKYDARIVAGAQYLASFDFDDYPQAFLNGVPVASSVP